MNYIKLLNAAFEKFFFDNRLNPTHISLYMALFQDWNSSRFADKFYVNRKDLMMASKIGSNSTYHKCIKDLDTWGYLSYLPSNNPYKESKIKMSLIGTSDELVVDRYSPILEQVAEQYSPKSVPVTERHHPISVQAVDSHSPISVQAVISTINNTKQVNTIKQPKGWQAIINFFFEKSFTADEGKKFFEHYANRNWKTSDGKAIRDWRALAANWMDRTELYSEVNKPKQKSTVPNQGQLADH